MDNNKFAFILFFVHKIKELFKQEYSWLNMVTQSLNVISIHPWVSKDNKT